MIKSDLNSRPFYLTSEDLLQSGITPNGKKLILLLI